MRMFIATLILASVAASAQAPLPIDPAKAEQAFAEARQISAKEGGRLWGKALYGPMLFVDPATRAVVANEPDAEGLLHKEGNLYIGTLPKDLPIADSPLEWAGKRWTMLRWPVPQETFPRQIKFAHELFHRIQPAIHLDAPDMPNLHLDTEEGRLWLQIEWRALTAALIESGPAQITAIRDALGFRAHRHQLFARSAESERSLEIAEGVPEYTGLVTAAPDTDAARWWAAAKLADPDSSITFVRSFAYTSGPAYGLLLDQRLPGWRAKLSTQSDLGDLLASTLHGTANISAQSRAVLYGASAIRIAEADRAARANAEKVRYHALLVDGATLTLPGSKKFSFSFNPSALISLGEAGMVYPTFHATDSWGTLDVTEGVLVPTDFSRAAVAAPTDTTGSKLHGAGWTLEMAPGWRLVPGSRPGSYTIGKD
jgi:hypothetical protein